jgi:hypothetical protein
MIQQGAFSEVHAATVSAVFGGVHSITMYEGMQRQLDPSCWNPHKCMWFSCAAHKFMRIIKLFVRHLALGLNG